MGNVSSFAGSSYLGWPCSDEDNRYVGPLPSFCSHERHQALIGQDGTGKFHTPKAAAYPPQLCETIAAALISSFLILKSLDKGGKEAHQSLEQEKIGYGNNVWTWDPGGPHPSSTK
eukprot:2921071-Karenia_brevis.AAC.1